MKQILIASVFLLTGCLGQALTGFDSGYPAHWPQPINSNKGRCPDLTGNWNNAGTASYDLGRFENLLSHRITGSLAEPLSVSFSSEPNTLNVEFRFDPNGLSKLTRNLQTATDFVCEDGAIWFNPKVQTNASGVGGYRAQKTLGLRKGVDGNLIGEVRLSSIGALMWIVPIGGTQTFWYRWVPVDK